MKIKFLALSALTLCLIGSAQAQSQQPPYGYDVALDRSILSDSSAYDKSFAFTLYSQSGVEWQAYANGPNTVQDYNTVIRSIYLFDDTPSHYPIHLISSDGFRSGRMSLSAGNYHFEVHSDYFNLNEYNFGEIDFQAKVFPSPLTYKPAQVPQQVPVPQPEQMPTPASVMTPMPDAPTPVAAVPEPQTYALLLGGLGVMGFVARRRKSV